MLWAHKKIWIYLKQSLLPLKKLQPTSGFRYAKNQVCHAVLHTMQDSGIFKLWWSKYCCLCLHTIRSIFDGVSLCICTGMDNSTSHLLRNFSSYKRWILLLLLITWHAQVRQKRVAMKWPKQKWSIIRDVLTKKKESLTKDNILPVWTRS